MLTRRITFSPSTLNREAGTVDAIASTGAPVQRAGYIERLDTSASAVSLAQNIPVLDSHRQGSIADVLGRVTGIRFEGGAIVVTLRISSPAALDAIERGDVTGVSIGYRVTSWTDTRADGVLTRTAAKWTLLEISLVPLPADPGATLRSEHPMSETTEPAAAQADPDILACRDLAASLGITSALFTDLETRGAPAGDYRAAVVAEMQRRSQAATVRTENPAAGMPRPPELAQTMLHMAEAMACRMMPSLQPSEQARPFMAMSSLDVARTLLQQRGEQGLNTMSREAVIHRAMHTTGDFPNLLTGAGNRVLAAAYQAAPNPLKLLARQATSPDFRPRTLLKISDGGPLQKVTEAGEITYTTRAEGAEAYSLATFAMIFALSRQALINDDMHAFADWSVAMGRAAAETEAAQLVALLTANAGTGPAMNDGQPLFATAHGNLAGTGTVISNATLGSARQALRTMKGVDGATPINAAPRYLVVGAARETEAEQVLAAIYAATGGNANIFSSKLELLVEPRLTAGAWYLFADPAVLPVLEYAYLAGAPGPQMASRDGWDVLGTEFRVVLDFGCGAIDWRGAYRNPGA